MSTMNPDPRETRLRFARELPRSCQAQQGQRELCTRTAGPRRSSRWQRRPRRPVSIFPGRQLRRSELQPRSSFFWCQVDPHVSTDRCPETALTFCGGQNRGAGYLVCYPGNGLLLDLGRRDIHASDAAPIPRGNHQLEYLRCWRPQWSRTLIWARRSGFAGVALDRHESTQLGRKRSPQARS